MLDRSSGVQVVAHGLAYRKRLHYVCGKAVDLGYEGLVAHAAQRMCPMNVEVDLWRHARQMVSCWKVA